MTRKIIATTALLLSLALPVMAQDQQVEQQGSYLGVNVQKTPSNQEGKQTIKNEKSFLFIIIQINGKVPFDKSEANN